MGKYGYAYPCEDMHGHQRGLDPTAWSHARDITAFADFYWLEEAAESVFGAG
jgi:hypothetical protein